ncbi:MFS family permease [Nocardia transvalensis]|uniref:MFS family permease n=1 Tax=Nocardia transvalensis TaxID=37333 RepID=A0A7W9PFJ9_9NOCA|nr:MFS family permease [Nocardia transvalensis]
MGIAMFGAISMVPLYLQVVREYSPTKSGLMMLPLVLGIMIGSSVAGAVTKATGRYKILPVLGTFVIAVGAVLFAQVKFDSPLWQPLAYSAVIGIGLGGCMQTLIIAAQAAGPRTDMGVSTAAATFFRQMGGTLGVTVFLTILFNLLPHKILDAFGGQLPAGFDAGAMTELQSNTAGIGALPAEVKEPILIGFTDSLAGVFYVGAAVSLLACVVLMFMKEIPLLDPADEAPSEPDRAEAQLWEGSAQALTEPEPVLAGAHARVESHGGTMLAERDGAARSATAVLVSSGYGAGEPHSLDGRIHREDGHAVADAALTLIDQRGHQVSRATGGSDGAYRIEAPNAGGYVLIVSANGYRPAAVNVTVGEWPQALDITLHGTGEVSGVVRASGRREPLPGVTVTLTDARGEVVGSAVSGGDGAYACHGVVPGNYTLVAVSDHMRPAATTLTVPDSGLLRHDIELGSTGVLAGLAWADGHAVPDAQVLVLDAHGDPIASARTDANGQYVLADLPEGEYTVVARGYPPSTSRVVVNGGELNHDVRLGYEERNDVR